MNNDKKIIPNDSDIIQKNDKTDDAVVINRDGLDVKKSGNIIIGTLNVFTKPFKNRHEKHYKESNFHFVADIILVLLVLILGISLYRFINLEPKIGVTLDISLVDESAISAAEVDFEINYKNETDRKMTEVFLTIDYPENFDLLNVLPESNYNIITNTYSIGSLESGANGIIKVRGVLFGGLGERQTILSVISFKDETRERKTLASLVYSIENSSLEFHGNFPKEVYLGSDFSGELEVENKSKIFFDDVKIVLKNNKIEIISVSGADVKNEGDKVIILIGQMAPTDKRDVQFVVKATEAFYSEKIEFDLLGEKNAKKLLQNRVSQDITVKEPKLQISLNSDNKIIQLDTAERYKIVLKNIEKEKISDISLVFDSVNKNFVVRNLKLYNNNFKVEDGVLSLGDLAVDESRELEVAINFKKIIDAKNQMTGLRAISSYNISDNRINKTAQSQIKKVNSSLEVLSGAFYYSKEGDQYGVGPLPPVVGIPTSYYIVWEVLNNGNEISDFIFKAKLGEGVLFTSTKSLLSGDLQYNKEKGEVIWQIDKIEALNGANKASFQVSIVPQDGDLGKTPVLLLAPIFSASDNYSDFKYTKKMADISTDLKQDAHVKSHGIVIKNY